MTAFPVLLEIGIAASGTAFVSGSVRVKLLPRHEPVEMSRRAAHQLFRLVEAYNWAVDSSSYMGRWTAFWPTLTVVERKLLVLLLMTNDVEGIGRPIRLTDVPVEFPASEGKPRWGRIHPAIAAEFRAILSQHYLRLTTADEIVVCWSRMPSARLGAERLKAMRALENVLDPAFGFQPDLVSRAVYEALLSGGVGQAEAAATAATMADELDHFLVEKEEKFWNDVADS